MRVTVIGSGVMGPGIAQTWLTGGHEVALTDTREEALRHGVESIRESLGAMHEKGILEKGPDEFLQLLSTTTSLDRAVEGTSLVVEAVPERPDIKQAVYSDLDRLCPEGTVIVSNTSALPLMDMFPDFRPDRFFICHYFNPPEIIPLVELVKGVRTDPEVVDWLSVQLEGCGKKPVLLKGYKVGFLINRLQVAVLREALYLVQCGIVDPQDIEAAATACIGFRAAWQGFFEHMDYTGLDTVALGCSVILPDLCNDTGVPEIITQKVMEGNLGVKSGRGFFSYGGGEGERLSKRRRDLLLNQLKNWRAEMLSPREG